MIRIHASDRMRSEDTQNYVVNDDNPFAIVIRDADGNIVETYYQTRTLYVNGTQYLRHRNIQRRSST